MIEWDYQIQFKLKDLREQRRNAYLIWEMLHKFPLIEFGQWGVREGDSQQAMKEIQSYHSKISFKIGMMRKLSNINWN